MAYPCLSNLQSVSPVWSRIMVQHRWHKSSSLTTSAINRAKWSSGSQSCSEGGNKNSCSRLQTRNRLLISESYEIPARAHKGVSLIAYLSPTHSPSDHQIHLRSSPKRIDNKVL